MKSMAWLVVGWWMVGGGVGAQEIVVRASQAEFAGGPLSVLLPQKPPPAALALRREDGTVIPAQWVAAESGGRLWWWQPPLRQGEAMRWRWTEARIASGQVEVMPQEGSVEVRIDGALFTRYVVQGAPKPYLWPLIGPHGLPVTRAFPMEEVAGEVRDHPHHRSLWFTHGAVNGVDFWSESPRAGRTVHREFLTLAGGPVLGVIRARTDWLSPEGKKVCEDVREVRIYRMPGGRLLDFHIEVRATEGPVTFGDTKEGSFGLRVATPLQVRGGQGHILNAAGQKDQGAWGKRAPWCDYFGPLGGEVVGIAVFDHPQNLRHPTYWHVRDYGLFAVNPFGIHDFTGAAAGSGDYTLPAGGTLSLLYRVWIHRGDPEAAQVERHYRSFAQPPEVSLR